MFSICLKQTVNIVSQHIEHYQFVPSGMLFSLHLYRHPASTESTPTVLCFQSKKPAFGSILSLCTALSSLKWLSREICCSKSNSAVLHRFPADRSCMDCISSCWDYRATFSKARSFIWLIQWIKKLMVNFKMPFDIVNHCFENLPTT